MIQSFCAIFWPECKAFRGKSLSVFQSLTFIPSSDPCSKHQAVNQQAAEMPKKEMTCRKHQSRYSFKIQINPGTTAYKQSHWGNYDFSGRISQKKKKDIKRVRDRTKRLRENLRLGGERRGQEILVTH